MAPQSNKKRAPRGLLLTITLLIPLLSLAVAEIGLRAAGLGALPPAFIDSADAPGFLQPNPKLVQRFFASPAQAPGVAIDTHYFRREKPTNGYRVFVLGESSAAGFPYGRWASPAGLLQQRLQRSLPDRDVEVINMGMAAITSYVLLDIADDVIAQRPDAVVIYTGHNEYLGIGGVGSSLASAKSPTVARAIQRLRRLRVYRTMELALSPDASSVARSATADGTLMARIAAERSIELRSSLYQQGEAQFRGNLERLLSRLRSGRVRVYIGTLASNERDQAPFVGGDAANAESAAARFARARELDASGQYAAARSEYLAAKDRDALRFRAPEAFNAIIRDVGARHEATVVDTQSALAAVARNGIIGSDLMLEHLHPTADGYFAMASAFYAAMRAKLPEAIGVADDVARAESPATAIDRLAGEYRVAVLKNDWPFVPERRPTTLPAANNAEENIAQRWFAGQLSWANAMNESLALYQRTSNVAESARVAANLADAFVHLAAPQQGAAVLMLRLDQAARALPYAARAARLEPRSPDYLLTYAEAQFRAGRGDASARTLQQILAVDPNESRAKYWLGVVTRETAAAPTTPP
jgi:lysophospholipase L1-like esterase